MKRWIMVLCAAMIFAGCKTANKTSNVAAPVPKAPTTDLRAKSSTKRLLTEAEASMRAALISNTAYALHINLTGSPDEFTGLAKISFDLKALPKDFIRLDLADAKSLKVSVNGQIVAAETYNGVGIQLPTTALRTGTNLVEVNYTVPYSHSGVGMHRVVDTEDKNVYLYTMFEPFDANRVFPCFDQPDLKAVFTLTVDAAPDAQVISYGHEKKVEKISGGAKRWTFGESKPMSTYLLVIVAGPYVKVFEGMASDGTPARLFVRKTMQKYVPVEFWKKITLAGLKFFNEYFAYRYPFKKYDQVIVPEFNMGAMENIGAVTFSERYLRRGGTLTKDEQEGLANTILHEMSHQWFGDLVTMKWWGDLWLNESFATLMAQISLQEVTEFKNSWHSFQTGTKQWAYYEDQLLTTHSIEAPAPDTDQAFVNFDGITYGKGASSMKQLRYFLGPDKFRNGLRQYFKTHAYKNATRADFMAALSTAAGVNLDTWTQTWLQTPGLNTAQVHWQCSGAKLDQIAIEQKCALGCDTLRPHRMRVGFFNKGSAIATQDVAYNGALTQVKLSRALDCPDFVLPNAGDEDYVKALLDEKSLEAVSEFLKQSTKPMERSLVWFSLWDLVREGQWSVREYWKVAQTTIASETNTKILGKVAPTIFSTRPRDASLSVYWPQNSAADRAEHTELLKNLEALAWTALQKAPAGSDLQKIWFDNFTKSVNTKTGFENLLNALDGKARLKGLQIDQDRRWHALVLASGSGLVDISQRLTDEKKRDPSIQGQHAALGVEVASPVLSAKKDWYKKALSKDSTMSLHATFAVLGGIYADMNQIASEELSPSYFNDLETLNKTSDQELQGAVAGTMAPRTCSEANLIRLEKWVKNSDQLSPVMSKPLKSHTLEEMRCVRARKVANQKSPLILK